MYRIDNATATGSLPAPGGVGPTVPGFFAPGVTTVDGDWLNAMQEELVHAITQSPNTPTLSKTDRTQLRTAILDYIASGVAGGLGMSNMIWLQYRTAAGVEPVTTTGGVWDTIPAATVVSNVPGWSESGGAVTLPAGDYTMTEGSVHGSSDGARMIAINGRLRQTSGTPATLSEGEPVQHWDDFGGASDIAAVRGVFTLGASQTVELQGKIDGLTGSATLRFGRDNNNVQDNVFSNILIWKVG